MKPLSGNARGSTAGSDDGLIRCSRKISAPSLFVCVYSRKRSAGTDAGSGSCLSESQGSVSSQDDRSIFGQQIFGSGEKDLPVEPHPPALYFVLDDQYYLVNHINIATIKHPRVPASSSSSSSSSSTAVLTSAIPPGQPARQSGLFLLFYDLFTCCHHHLHRHYHRCRNHRLNMPSFLQGPKIESSPIPRKSSWRGATTCL